MCCSLFQRLDLEQIGSIRDWYCGQHGASTIVVLLHVLILNAFGPACTLEYFRSGTMATFALMSDAPNPEPLMTEISL
jgi:hypothetical protein